MPRSKASQGWAWRDDRGGALPAAPASRNACFVRDRGAHCDHQESALAHPPPSAPSRAEKHYAQAVEHYTLAIKLNPTNAVYYWRASARGAACARPPTHSAAA